MQFIQSLSKHCRATKCQLCPKCRGHSSEQNIIRYLTEVDILVEKEEKKLVAVY